MLNNELWQAPLAGGGGFYDHQIAHSLRMSDANNTTLKITAGTPTSSKTFTYSWWWKRYNVTSTSTQSSNVFCAGTSGGAYVFWPFTNNSVMQANFNFTGGNFGDSRLTTNMQFRDTSAWYHCVLRFDSTQATASNRVRLYVNGVEPTYSSASVQTDIAQDEDISFMNQDGVEQGWGGLSGKGTGQEGCDVQLAEIVFNDGQSYGPDSYGETKNGVWIPKDPSGLTFGDNGYYLNFASSSDLGNDVSGNNNDFTPANLSAHDQMLDSPTFNSDSNANFPTINVLDPTVPLAAISEGNLQITEVANNRGGKANFGIPSSGKWYWEVYANNNTSQENWAGITGPDTDSSGDGRGGSSNSTTYGINFSQYGGGGVMSIRKFIEGTESGVSGSLGTTAYGVLGITVNQDDNEVKYYHNNTLYITNAISATQEFFPAGGCGGGTNATTLQVWNFGQDGTFAGNLTAQGNSDANGYGNFTYAPPSGFLALCSGNLPTAAEVDPAQTDDDYPQKLFSPTLYTGNGGTNNITGVGFQPDWTWIKGRSTTYNNRLWDSSRGATKYLQSNTTGAEATLSTGLTSFDSDGFTLGSGGSQNNSGSTFVAWNWRANGGTTSTNTQGDIDSTVQVDPSGCFSIVKYTGGLSSSGVETVGHGLSKAPSLFITKSMDKAGNWWVFSDGQTNWNYGMNLNSDGASVDKSGNGSMSAPTSTVFSTNYTDGLNENGNDLIAYCFANCEGYMKFGSYVGNGNADGSFIYTGFRPSMLFVKLVASAGDWWIQDDGRSPYNPANKYISWDRSDAEATGLDVDILSNGFKIRTASGDLNSNGASIIYGAWAKNPFQYATAR